MPSTTETRQFAKGLVLGVFAMTLVGGSVAVSVVLGDAPLFTAQAIRYAIATALLALIARIARVRIGRPRGTEWLWLSGIAATGLVLFNVAVIRGVGSCGAGDDCGCRRLCARRHRAGRAVARSAAPDLVGWSLRRSSSPSAA